MNIKELIEKRCKQYGNLCSYYNGYTIRITPLPWNNYCACWYKGDSTLLECENGITSEQAARAIEQFEEWTEWYSKEHKTA